MILCLLLISSEGYDLCSLGKTLQSITLLYTLLRQGFDGKPMVKKAIIVTPTSLVSNWEAEIKKWVGERVLLVSLCESTRDDVVSGIDRFTSPCSPLQVNLCNYFGNCLERCTYQKKKKKSWKIYLFNEYFPRCWLFHTRHSGCIHQNLVIVNLVTFSYVMRLTGWKMIRR